MTGNLWAAVAGIGFGFFQSFNRRGGRSFNPYFATFILLLISAIILAAGSVITEDLSVLKGVPLIAYINFSLAGIVHFFIGWTFLTISQNRVGAARTGALVGATPLFATIIAAFAFEEILDLPILFGVVTVVAGVYIVSISGRKMTERSSLNWRNSVFGLGTALCFSISPIFIRGGLEDLPSPLLGVTVGMGVSAIVYGFILLIRREPIHLETITGDAWIFQLSAAVFVGLSTWMRWIALDLTQVGVVLALGRLNVPVVILLSPLLVGKSQENVTVKVWIGAGLVVAGSLILIYF